MHWPVARVMGLAFPFLYTSLKKLSVYYVYLFCKRVYAFIQGRRRDGGSYGFLPPFGAANFSFCINLTARSNVALLYASSRSFP